MVSINYSAREVCCKIVYYGPGLSGKTTNLQYVHTKVPQNTRGKLISLATEADRTLYFDFLPINIGTINGFQAKFQLYTVPGQVYYNATRKLVLRGVDGVVFVADSQVDKMDENIESLANLEENLLEYGYDINQLPIVIQYNKRDLPNVMSLDELNAKLNPKGRPTFEASATIGNGVFDTLKMIIKIVLDRAKSTNTQAVPQTSAPSPQPISQPSQPAAKEPVSVALPAAAQNVSEPMAAQSQPQPETAPAYRPYPGGEDRVAVETPPAVETKTETAAEPESNPVPDEVPSPESVSQQDGSGSPQMAPSLRRRPEKKRGFFKRLFGVK